MHFHIECVVGRLDKDDLNTKIGHLSRKVAEVKCEVHDALQKRYIEFYPIFDYTSDLSARVRKVQEEMEEMAATIDKQVCPKN